MTLDYSSTAGGTWGMRPKPVAIIGTPAVSGTIVANPGPSATAGSAPTATRIPATSNASNAIKGSAGRVFGFSVSNPGAAAAWFNVYNIVTATIGATQPLLQVLVPAGGNVDFEPPYGVAFSTGICIAATDTSSVLSSVAPATALVACVIWL